MGSGEMWASVGREEMWASLRASVGSGQVGIPLDSKAPPLSAALSLQSSIAAGHKD